jgi:hypothetical protein
MLIAAGSTISWAQDRAGWRPDRGGAVADRFTPSPPSDTADSSVTPVTRLLNKWQPLQDRVVQNERLRMLSGMVGLGVLAVEGTRTAPQLPLGAIGTEALRMGLHPQLRTIRERTGYSIEPSIGHRRFALTFYKTLR